MENIKELERRIEADYQREVAAAEEKRLRRLNALEEIGGLLVPANEPTNGSDQIVDGQKVPTLIAAIQDVLRYTLTGGQLGMGAGAGHFDINSIRELLEVHYPELKKPGGINPTSISGSLKKLAREGVVEVESKGKGQKPTIYKYDPAKKALLRQAMGGAIGGYDRS